MRLGWTWVVKEARDALSLGCEAHKHAFLQEADIFAGMSKRNIDMIASL